jgi:translocator protein
MSILSLAVWLGLCFATAAVGRRAGPDSWYRGMNKPTWNPPDWVFAPVWTTLFILMAVAAALVWARRGQSGAGIAITAFLLTLILNALWSWLFFGFHRPDLAFFEVIPFWFAILLTTVLFWRISPLAGKLMVPYLLWVGFASYLNFILWRMNPYVVGRP